MYQLNLAITYGILLAYSCQLLKLLFSKGNQYGKIFEVTKSYLIMFCVFCIVPVFFISSVMNVSHSVFIMIFTGILFITFLTDKTFSYTQQKWINVIYYLGIICTYAFTIIYYMYFAFYELVSVEFFFMSIMGICALILFCFAPFGLIAILLSFRKLRYHRQNESTERYAYDKFDNYREKGLTDEEIDYFRNEMKEAKSRIQVIEQNMNQVAKLRMINQRYNTINIMKDFFKGIVKEPNRLVQAGVFLNKLLPSLEDLTSKYVEVSQHIAKNKQTYLILEKSVVVIDELCQSIEEQYLSFHQSLFDEFDDEIELASKNLSKVKKNTVTATPEHEDTVDELVDKPFE